MAEPVGCVAIFAGGGAKPAATGSCKLLDMAERESRKNLTKCKKRKSPVKFYFDASSALDRTLSYSINVLVMESTMSLYCSMRPNTSSDHSSVLLLWSK